jgi:hypothetical protein
MNHGKDVLKKRTAGIKGDWIINGFSNDAVYGSFIDKENNETIFSLTVSIFSLAKIVDEVTEISSTKTVDGMTKILSRRTEQKQFDLEFLQYPDSLNIPQRGYSGTLQELKQILNKLFPEQTTEDDELVLSFSKSAGLNHDDMSVEQFSDDEGVY